MKITRIFVVEGYDNLKDDTYTNVRKFELIADSADEAIKRAQELLPCPHFRVWGVIEKIQ